MPNQRKVPGRHTGKGTVKLGEEADPTNQPPSLQEEQTGPLCPFDSEQEDSTEALLPNQRKVPGRHTGKGTVKLGEETNPTNQPPSPQEEQTGPLCRFDSSDEEDGAGDFSPK